MESSLYIDLMKRVLLGMNHVGREEYRVLKRPKNELKAGILSRLGSLFEQKDIYLCSKQVVDPGAISSGKRFSTFSDTMIGVKRLENIEYCVSKILEEKIPGDLIETGVWRGGATIFMRALLKAKNVKDRSVWVADSFEGLPKPNETKYQQDAGDLHYQREDLKISLEHVKGNFAKYDLLDEQVKFLKGWFKDTLPSAPIESLALIRLDGDMYESTMDGLVNLYPKLSKGGYIIIDDWGAVKGCRQAVLDYRKEHGISEKITEIDWTGVYWKKE